ncbi:MAG: diguanylate cyclase [Pseudomonadota bacterium]|nr:diguanylate cyclase [Pseudomonadota bacterium]
MSNLSAQTDTLISELDAAVEAHMDWSRRILRCAVLRSTPGDDVLEPMAHTLCRFGRWFSSNRERFDALDPQAAQRVDGVHRTMHDAIRSICTQVMNGNTGQNADLDAFELSQSELLSLLARFKTLIISQAVRHDPLTGLPLRYGLQHDFSLIQKDAQRNRNQLYLAMIDVDHFKHINDKYGHPVGDKVLHHLAEVMKQSLRGNEPLYRFGGEEFLWLLQCHSDTEAERSALRLLAAIREISIPLPDGASLTLTITLGLARVGEEEELSSAIKRADAALYEGKNAGRDRYVIAVS